VKLSDREVGTTAIVTLRQETERTLLRSGSERLYPDNQDCDV
jgi:hypothetical protein